nr:hypothetical protein [Tanacetum cinerariifolium]
MWEVEVFTLSTRFWKTVYMDAPFKSCDLSSDQVFVNGVIYFRAIDQFNVNLENEVRPHFIISFDLRSEKFGEVRFPEGFVHTCDRNVTKLNESLGLLGYYAEGDMTVCDVWTMLDGANNTFSKKYTVRVQGLDRVLEFRNNGEVVIELVDDDDSKESRLEVYEPLSGHTNRVGINGKAHRFSASSYMETLLLLDESDSVIH